MVNRKIGQIRYFYIDLGYRYNVLANKDHAITSYIRLSAAKSFKVLVYMA